MRMNFPCVEPEHLPGRHRRSGVSDTANCCRVQVPTTNSSIARLVKSFRLIPRSFAATSLTFIHRWFTLNWPDSVITQKMRISKITRTGECAGVCIYRACQRGTHSNGVGYAQTRYEEITGWQCPVADGPRSHELKGKDRETDQEAREQISKELGHNREQVTAIYLGR